MRSAATATWPIVQAPRSLPRVVAVPRQAAGQRFVALSTIVDAFVARLFPGMEVLGCYQFRVTRNSDLFVDDEEVDDLRRALEGELAHRRYGARCDSRPRRIARQQWSISCCSSSGSSHSIGTRCRGPVNLNRLSAIYDLVAATRPQVSGVHAGAGRTVLAAPTTCSSRSASATCCCTSRSRDSRRCMDLLRQAAADPRCWPSSRRCIAPAIIHTSSMRW